LKRALKEASVKLSILAAAIAVIPAAARADFGIRAGAEALVFRHDSNTGTKAFITDQSTVTFEVMASYWLPANFLSLDLEVGEGWDFKGNNRVGTIVRPGATLSLPILPFYIRGAIPIKCEGEGPTIVGLRAGLGTYIGVPLIKLYLEADADFPFGGGSGAPDAFKRQDISVGGGVALRF
jgi:hypothetical protein